MKFRIASAVMAVFFAYAIIVQLNDPDPVGWIAMYGGALLITVVAAVRGMKLVMAAAVGSSLICLLWAGLLAPQAVADGFSLEREVPRELFGLVIVGAWMAAVAWNTRRRMQAER